MKTGVLFLMMILLMIPTGGTPLAICEDGLANYVPLAGTDAYPTPTGMPLPAPREAWIDPIFGTCLLRVTDREQDVGRAVSGLRNEYSRVQAFNADESLMIVRGTEGDWFLYDAATLEPIKELNFGGAVEPRWSVTDPESILLSPLDLTLATYDVGRDVQIPAHDFVGELPAEWGAAYVWRRYEGSPSADGRYDALLGEDQDFVTRGLITYDWRTDAILGMAAVPNSDKNEPDSVSISPLGNFVLAQFEYCERGFMGTYEAPCGAMVYTRDLTQGWGIARIIGHSDLALDANGREVLVYQEIDTDQIVMADLETGEITPLLGLDFSEGAFGLHFSGQAFQRPGWVAVSVHPEAAQPDFSNSFWMVGTIFALELRANPRVVQLAHHHSLRSETEADYFAEPQVTVNHDFTRLLFGSNWGRYGAGEVEMYMIVLPEDWTERLPE
jgi:hypothetical protein